MNTDETLQTFAELGLSASLVETLQEIGYESPTPIQSLSIPVLLSGRDLLGQAQTGTGKTAAFALPLLNNIDVSLNSPQVLVLTPTRELTIQVAEAFQTYARKLKSFHVLPIYGGQPMPAQLRQLRRGPQVVVGTPGRIMDHLRRQSLELSSLRTVVLDEADEMLNMGFVEDIECILEHTPEEKQIALFSATMPEAIRRVAAKYLREQEEIKVKARTATVETISQNYWLVAGLHKLDALTRILEVEEFDAALIFVRTKTATVELAEKLEARGHACAALNGDLSQELRERTINGLKKGDIDIVVATDVAARGLDVERVTHVLNYDIPYDAEAYVHRIGRTGRAGRQGKAILFVSPRERRLLSSIERTTRQPIAVYQLPTKKEVSERRIQRFREQVEHTLLNTDLSYYAPIVEDLARDRDTDLLRIASALCFLQQRDTPFILEESAAPELSRAGKTFERRSAEERQPRRGRRDDSDLMTFRIEVGRKHGVSPSNIVGAIANSTGIKGSAIGHIDIFEQYSTVDLPRELPREVLAYLQNLRIQDQKLHIRPADHDRTEESGSKAAFQKKTRFGKDKDRREKPRREKFERKQTGKKAGPGSSPGNPDNQNRKQLKKKTSSFHAEARKGGKRKSRQHYGQS
jgi:ATP-dependent RNA helicase DeaD